MTPRQSAAIQSHLPRVLLAGTTPEELAALAQPARGCKAQINRNAENVQRRREIVERLYAYRMSMPEIAEVMGYRSHAAVHAILRGRLRTLAGKVAE